MWLIFFLLVKQHLDDHAVMINAIFFFPRENLHTSLASPILFAHHATNQKPIQNIHTKGVCLNHAQNSL